MAPSRRQLAVALAVAVALAPAATAAAGSSNNNSNNKNAAAPANNNNNNAAPLTTTTTRLPAPLASSAILFYTKEYSTPQFGEPKTRCEQLVESIRAESGSDAINFVPTIFFVDDGSTPDGEPAAKTGPRASCKPDNWPAIARVGHFCYKRQWDAPCEPPTAADVEEFSRGLAGCVGLAQRLGFKQILVSPHIDDAANKGLWRNMVDFNPTAADKHGNSYWSVLLEPLVRAGAGAAAAAASAAAASSKGSGGGAPLTVWLGMQGEMGRPVFSDPAAWSEVAAKAREVWAASGGSGGSGNSKNAAAPSSAAPSPQQLRVGVLLPYRMISGVNNYGPAPPSEPVLEPDTALGRLGGSDHPLPPKAWPLAEQHARQAPALAKLFRRDLDFLGVSNYVKSPAPDVQPRDLDKAFKIAAAELKAASSAAPGGGLDLGALARGADGARKAGGKAPLALVWSEFGVGGGRSRCGDAPAKSAAEAGRWPHAGMFGSYTPESDPWAGSNAFPGAKQYRKAFHDAALRLLAAGGSREFPLAAGYLWSLTSWDPQAVHPASRAPSGQPRTGYYDADVAGAIRAHNERAAAAAAAATAGAGAARNGGGGVGGNKNASG